MHQPTLLSCNGSDRATTYPMSCKIVRRGDTLLAGWLDAPERKGLLSRVMLGVCDATTGELRAKIKLGEAHDNHCGPAFALEPDGRTHAIIGAHGYSRGDGRGDLRYRWSDTPADATTWSEPERLGPGDTYPSLVVDGSGTLHLAHRESGSTEDERWQIWYRRKRCGQPWEDPQRVVVNPTPGYCNFQQSLALGLGGDLHMLFHFRYGSPRARSARDCRATSIAHLRSEDCGTTWLSDGQPLGRLPAEMDDLALIHRRPDGGLYITNNVVDADDHPWFVSTDPDTPSGVLWHMSDGGWEALRLDKVFPGVGARIRPIRESISRDGDGRTHLVLPVLPGADDPGADSGAAAELNSTLPESLEVYGGATGWFDPRLELYHLVADGDGRQVSTRQLTKATSPVAHWLPALEWWDWQRADEACADGPWLMYTVGLNRGGSRADNRNALIDHRCLKGTFVA